LFAIDGEPARNGIREIGLIDDVVAVEHRSRFPTSHLHDFAFGYARATVFDGS